MKKKPVLFYLLLTLCCLTVSRAVNLGISSSEIVVQSKLIYVDVNISQPGVNDCYDDTSTPDLNIMDWFQLYPNPNNGFFTVEINHISPGERVTIYAMDPTGRKVFQTSKTAFDIHLKQELDLSDLVTGIYFIHVKMATRNSVKKVIIY